MTRSRQVAVVRGAADRRSVRAPSSGLRRLNAHRPSSSQHPRCIGPYRGRRHEDLRRTDGDPPRIAGARTSVTSHRLAPRSPDLSWPRGDPSEIPKLPPRCLGPGRPSRFTRHHATRPPSDLRVAARRLSADQRHDECALRRVGAGRNAPTNGHCVERWAPCPAERTAHHLNLRAPDIVATELFVINEDSAHALGLP